MHSQEMKSLMATLVRNYMLPSYLSEHADELEATMKRTSFDTFRGAFKIDNKYMVEEEDIEQIFASLKEASEPDKIRKMLLEMAVCRNVEAVDFYLALMLRKVYTQRPEMLRAKDFSVQMSEVLQCSTIDEVIFRVAERKIQELSYKGLSDIIKHLNSIHGLKFDEKNPAYVHSQEIFQTRNIIIHNASIVNEVYLQHTTRTDLKVGDEYPLNKDYLNNCTASLLTFSLALDKQFVSHFKLS